MQPNIILKAKEAKKQVVGQTITLLSGAFALVAALAWNDAVKSLIDSYFPAGKGLYSKFIYAFLLTVLVVFVTTRLQKYSIKEEE